MSEKVTETQQRSNKLFSSQKSSSKQKCYATRRFRKRFQKMSEKVMKTHQRSNEQTVYSLVVKDPVVSKSVLRLA